MTIRYTDNEGRTFETSEPFVMANHPVLSIDSLTVNGVPIKVRLLEYDPVLMEQRVELLREVPESEA